MAPTARIVRQFFDHSRRIAAGRVSSVAGNSTSPQPASMSSMYGTGCSRATPALSSSE